MVSSFSVGKEFCGNLQRKNVSWVKFLTKQYERLLSNHQST